mmetsp:Transcript_83286/g.166682  ORF Transcript_83286/g.166682 Transcript_83286/m.166682 type:complete len:230 (-) Transcript_83286:724-1413(-)
MQKSQDRQAPGIAAHVVAQAHEVRRLDGECGEGGRRTAAAVAAAEKEFCERHVALPEGSAEVLGARGGARLEEDTDARLACPKQNGLLEQRAPVLVPWLAPVAEVEVPPPLRPVLEQEVFKHGSTAPGPGGFAEDGGGNDGIIYPWHHRAVRGQGPHDRNAPLTSLAFEESLRRLPFAGVECDFRVGAQLPEEERQGLGSMQRSALDGVLQRQRPFGTDVPLVPHLCLH